MKVDKIILNIFSLIRKKNYRKTETDPNVKKEKAILKRVKHINPHSTKTYFILPGWYENPTCSKKFRKRIKQKRNSYIFINFLIKFYRRELNRLKYTCMSYKIE